jgi:hypothetical protein
MRKATLLVLIAVIVFSCFTLVSCDRSYDEGEVLSIAKELIEKSKTLNELYYGEGIAYIDDESRKDGSYYEADYLSLSKFGIKTVDDIKNLTRSVYTVEYSNILINTKLSSVSSDNSVVSLARYYQKKNSETGENECIMVYKDAKVFLEDTVIYDYDSMKVSDVDEDIIYVTLSVTVINSENKSQTSSLTVGLIEEENGFRLDTPTYKTYIKDDYL